jgi:hypothetical protein
MFVARRHVTSASEQGKRDARAEARETNGLGLVNRW